VNVIFRKELAGAADPVSLRAELLAAYSAQLVHPYFAAERGLVDAVIDPAQTRAVVASGLAMLRNKQKPPPRRKHGNIPL
jgi:acetyl-CoA carboxylase carboxyltransferase component